MHLRVAGRSRAATSGLGLRADTRRRGAGVAAAAVCLLSVLILVGALGGSPAQAGSETIIAWTPSHQNDTGGSGWHEYLVCGDITQRAMALLADDFTNVLCWETGMGLTSHNYAALGSETAQANAANAQISIAVHVNGGAASGVLGNYYAGDYNSGNYGENLLRSVAAAMGMRYWYMSGRTGVFLLDPANNNAPVRVLLELGDNQNDRALLSSEEGRQRMAEALAQAVRQYTPPASRYQQGDLNLNYTGKWTVGYSSSASGGSFRYANATGASVTAAFTGTSLTWLGKMGPSYGKARVTLDADEPVLVDLYAKTDTWKQTVWETGALAPGEHTVKIEWTGIKSVSGGGTTISVDALDILGTLVGAPPPEPGLVRYEQTRGEIAYAGKWTTFSASGSSAGTYAYADSEAGATIYFDGTQLDWIATKGVTMGKAEVSLDDAAPVLVDLYRPSVLRQQKVWSTGTLGAGAHKLVIRWTGRPSVAGGGTRVNIDALEVMGEVVQAPRSGPTRYEQADRRIAYSGVWVPFSASGASGGNYTYADSSASATICFDGTQLDWMATKGVTMGRAYVSVDGGTPVLVALYNSSVQRQRKVWSTGALTAGQHVIVISWTGSAGAAGGGTRVNIDALDVLGTLLQATG